MRSKSSISKKTEENKFDAGDFHTIKSSFIEKFGNGSLEDKVDEKAIAFFRNISIDPNSIEFLKIAKNERIYTRFAVLDLPQKIEGKETQFHLVFQPTLPAEATKNQIETMNKSFGTGNVPQAEPTLTGLVHQKTGDIRARKASLNRFSRCDLHLISELKDKKNPETNTLYIDPFNGDYITRNKGQIYTGNLLDSTGDPSIDLSQLTQENLSDPTLRKKILDVTSSRKHTLSSQPYDCSHDFMLPNYMSNDMEGGMGLSLSIQIDQEKKLISLYWMGRSTMQYKVFNMNPLAYRCFLFENYTMGEDGTFKGRVYTSSFPSERSIQHDIMQSILDVATEIIKKELDPKSEFKIESILNSDPGMTFPGYNPIFFFKPFDLNLLFANIWKEIRNNKAAIAERLLNTIYVISGLQPEEKPGEFWIKETDHEIVKKTLDIAKENDIILDLNKTPEKFKPKGMSPLALAIKMNKFDIVFYLVEGGATPTRELIQEAIVPETSENIKEYLTLCVELNESIQQNNIKQFNACLEKNKKDIVDMNRPIGDSYTPLDKTIEMNNYEMVRKLIENKVDMIMPFPRTNKSALAHAQSLEMQCLLLQCGASFDELSPEDPSYEVANLLGILPKNKVDGDDDPKEKNDKLMQLLIKVLENNHSQNPVSPFFIEDMIKWMKRNTKQLLFEMPADPEQKEKETILTYAVKKDCSPAIIEQLVNENPLLLNQMNEKKETPLLLAIRMKRFDTVFFLLKNGASLDGINKEECFSNLSLYIIKLVKEDNFEKIKEILKEFPNLSLDTSDEEKESAKSIMQKKLFLYAQSGEPEKIKEMQSALSSLPEDLFKSLINAKDEQDNTALLLAAYNGNLTLMQFLCDNGVNLSVRNKKAYGFSENLHLGIVKLIKNESFENVKEILKEYRDISFRISSEEKETITSIIEDKLSFYSRRGEYQKMKKMVLSLSPLTEDLFRKLINTKDENGNTALLLAAYQGDYSFMEFLDNRGADLEVINKKGLRFYDSLNLGIIKLVKEEKFETLKSILKEYPGFSPEISSEEKETITSTAQDKLFLYDQRGEYKKIQEMLLSLSLLPENLFRSLINAKDENGNTALLLAAYQGDFALIQLLCDKGADLGVENKKEHGFYANLSLCIINLVKEENYEKIKEILSKYKNLSLDIVNDKDETAKIILKQKLFSYIENNDFNKINEMRLLFSDDVFKSLLRDELFLHIRIGDIEKIKKMQCSLPDDVLKPLLQEELLSYSREGDLAKIKNLQTLISPDIFKPLINLKDEEGNTALLWAAYHGHIPLIEWLYHNGADFNVKAKNGCGFYNNLSLHIINLAKKENFEKIKEILQVYPDVLFTIPNEEKETTKSILLDKFLIYSQGKLDKIKEMQSALPESLFKSLINTTGEHGDVALLSASRYGNFSIIEFLHNNGADLNVKDGNGYGFYENLSLYIMELARTEDFKKIAEVLKEYPVISFTIPNDKKETAKSILYAKFLSYSKDSLHKILEMQSALPEKLFNSLINTKDETGNTALLNAARFGKLPIIQWLYDNGADFSIKDKYGNGFFENLNRNIIELVKKDDFKRIEAILKFPIFNKLQESVDYSRRDGIDKIKEMKLITIPDNFLKSSINVKDRSNNTALLRAAYRGDLSLIRFLLRNGADSNVKNDREYGFYENLSLCIMEKIRKENFKAITGILQEYPDTSFTIPNEKNETAKSTLQGYLFDYIRLGDLDSIKEMQLAIPEGLFTSLINAKDENGNTALLSAAYGGNIAIIQFLLSQGVDFSVKNDNGSGFSAQLILGIILLQKTENYKKIAEILHGYLSFSMSSEQKIFKREVENKQIEIEATEIDITIKKLFEDKNLVPCLQWIIKEFNDYLNINILIHLITNPNFTKAILTIYLHRETRQSIGFFDRDDGYDRNKINALMIDLLQIANSKEVISKIKIQEIMQPWIMSSVKNEESRNSENVSVGLS